MSPPALSQKLVKQELRDDLIRINKISSEAGTIARNLVQNLIDALWDKIAAADDFCEILTECLEKSFVFQSLTEGQILHLKEIARVRGIDINSPAECAKLIEEVYPLRGTNA